MLKTLAKFGANHRRKEHAYTKALFELIETEGGGFLLPQSMKHECTHNWRSLDSGFACCVYCGDEHDCSEMSQCKCVISESSERVCVITGCVVSQGEFREERNAFERTGYLIEGAEHHHQKRLAGKGNPCSFFEKDGEIMRQSKYWILSVFDNNATKFHETIEGIVRDILFSKKTEICFFQEIKRNESKMISMLSRLLRECAHNKECLRPNMLNIMGQLFYAFRKHRLFHHKNNESRCEVIESLIQQCTHSIANLIINYGGQRVAKQLQNHYRCREFICSMLYLMRMGITYQNRQLLPKVEALNEFLPMQVLLPLVFKIRAKSITEGENIIKLDIRKLPF